MRSSFASWDEGWGRCLCPGVSPDRVIDHRACASDGSPWAWGEPPLLLTQRCAPALAEGWVVEKIAASVYSPNFVAALDHGGRLHVMHLDPEGVQHLVREPEGWTSELITELSELSFMPGDLAIDEAGALHIANGSPYGYAPSYASNASGSWLVEDLPAELGAHQVDLRVAAQGALQYSYLTDYDGLFRATYGPEGWTTKLVTGEQIRSFAALELLGKLGWLLYMQDERVLWLDAEGGEPRLVLAAGSDSSVAATRDGDLLVPYVPRGTGSVHLARVHGGELSDEQVWKLSDGRYDLDGALGVSVAVDGADRALLVHGTPEGLALETRDETGFHLTLLVPELESSAHTMTPPRLLVDPEGAAHILYWLDADTANHEIRHVFRGSCPEP
jgi:hypothetical protein